MSNIKFKRSSVSGKIPLTTDLDFGELAVNYADGTIYYKNTLTQIQSVGSVHSTALRVTTSTASTSTTTGALQVAGGVGIGGSLYAGNIYSNGTLLTAGGATVSDTSPISPVNGDLWWDSNYATLRVYYNDGTSSQWVDASAVGANFNGGTITNPLIVDNATASTSTTTGALTVEGGVGVGGSMYVGGVSTFTNKLVVSNTTVSTSTNTGALTVAGGVGVGGNLYVGGVVTATTFYGALTGIATTATTATSAATAYSTVAVHTAGTGLSGSTFNGSTAQTWTLNTTTLMATAVTATSAAVAYSLATTGTTYVNRAVLADTATTSTNAATAYSTLAVHTAGTGLSGSTFNGSTAQTWTLNTTTLMAIAVTATSAGTAYALATTGTTYVNRAVLADTATTATSAATAYSWLGGSVPNATTFANTLTITSTASSTSTTTGALQVAGGVGIGGGLYVGGTVTATVLRTPAISIALGEIAGVGQGTYAVAIGSNAGNTSQASQAIAIGFQTGQINQKTNAVAIGVNAGLNNQGANAIAIGAGAGTANQPPGSIIFNADPANNNLNAANTGTYIFPIRADATSSATTYGVYYNPVTKELTTSTAATGGGLASPYSGIFTITNTTAASSTITGALQVAGGVGIAKNLYVGGVATFSNNSSPSIVVGDGTSDTGISFPSTSYTNLQVGVGGTLWIRNSDGRNFFSANATAVSVPLTTSASSTDTGALIVAGGVGVGGDVYVGGTVTATVLRTLSNNIALGNTAGDSGQQTYGVAIGASAGRLNQGVASVAIGLAAAQGPQGDYSVAIGPYAGMNSSYSTPQGPYAIAIGYQAGMYGQPSGSIIISATSTNFIGTATNQGLYITPIRADATTSATTYGIYYNPETKELTTSTAATGGSFTGGTVAGVTTFTNTLTVADIVIGNRIFAGGTTGTNGQVLIATGSGIQWTSLSSSFNGGTITNPLIVNNANASTSTITGALQVTGGVGVGGTVWATQLRQTSDKIAIGGSAGTTSQGVGGIAIGGFSGGTLQGAAAVAVGSAAGNNTQGTNAIAIGNAAGNIKQGPYAIAIGANAGNTSQHTGSVVISAINAALNTVNTGTFIAPIRADATTSATTYGIYYNPATKELTTSTVAGGGGGGGSPGGTDTQVQFNNAGVFAGSAGLTYNTATNITSLGGVDPALNITGIVEEHDTPAAGTLSIYAKSIAGRMLPKWIGPSGFDTPFQALVAQNKIAWWNPPGNSTTIPGNIGMGTLTASGSAVARNVGATNIFTRAKRLGYNGAGTAGQAGGHRDPTAQYTIGAGAGLGGFYYVCRFGSADTLAQAIAFTGLSSTTGAPVVTSSPATFTNSIGIGCATGDVNYSIYYGGSAAQTPIALGVGFPCKTAFTDLIELVLFAASNTSLAVGYRATNLSKNASFTAAISGTALTSSAVTVGAVSIGQTISGPNIAVGTKITAGSGTAWTVSISQTVAATPVQAVTVEAGTLTAATAGTQLPSSTTFLAHRAYRSNNATAAAVSIDIVSIYIEVDT